MSFEIKLTVDINKLFELVWNITTDTEHSVKLLVFIASLVIFVISIKNGSTTPMFATILFLMILLVVMKVSELTESIEKVGLINTFVLFLIVAIVRQILKERDRRQKQKSDEVNELRAKMNDRLVETETVINQFEPIPEKLKDRLQKTASRLRKYSNTLEHDTNLLITWWKIRLKLHEQGSFSEKELSKTRKGIDLLVKKIKLSLDKMR